MKSRHKGRKFLFGLCLLFVALWAVCIRGSSYGPLEQPLPKGSILLTTGSLDNILLIKLPSREIIHPDMSVVKKDLRARGNHEEGPISQVSGPRHGVMAILLDQGPLMIARNAAGDWRILKWKFYESLQIRTMALSPDGRYLAYCQWTGNSASNLDVIGILDLETGKQRVLARNGATDTGPGNRISWSADGSTVGVILSVSRNQLPSFEPDSVAGYLSRTKEATAPVACRIRLSNGEIEPICIASSVRFSEEGSPFYLAWAHEWYCSDAFGQTPHPVAMTAEPEHLTAILAGGLALIAPTANRQDEEAQLLGKRKVANGDGFINFEATVLAVRVSRTDGHRAVALARVQPASDSWDTPSGFSMSFGD